MTRLICASLTLFLLTLTIDSRSTFGQSNWKKAFGNPVLDAGAAGSWDEWGVLALGVYYDGAIYHMWYTSFSATEENIIGYASSPNASTWTKSPANPIMLPSAPGSWDEAGPGSPSVQFVDNKYEMWYDSRNAADITGIGYASSSDVSSWERYENNPVLRQGEDGEWDSEGIMTPMVLFENGVYHMWYSGWDGTNTRIGKATSTDGLNWTKFAGNPVLDLGPAGSWDAAYVLSPAVLIDGDVHRMWYEGSAAENPNSPFPDGGAIGYAESSDGGLTWTKHDANPVLEPGEAGSWDDHTVFPEVLRVGSNFQMWYSGQNEASSTWRIGYAIDNTKTSTEEFEPPTLSDVVFLEPNHPNPFNSVTKIAYRLADEGIVQLSVYNRLGVKVRDLVYEWQPAGSFQAEWNGRDDSNREVGAGLYQCRLTLGTRTQVHSMILLR